MYKVCSHSGVILVASGCAFHIHWHFGPSSFTAERIIPVLIASQELRGGQPVEIPDAFIADQLSVQRHLWALVSQRSRSCRFWLMTWVFPRWVGSCRTNRRCFVYQESLWSSKDYPIYSFVRGDAYEFALSRLRANSGWQPQKAIICVGSVRHCCFVAIALWQLDVSYHIYGLCQSRAPWHEDSILKVFQLVPLSPFQFLVAGLNSEFSFFRVWRSWTIARAKWRHSRGVESNFSRSRLGIQANSCLVCWNDPRVFIGAQNLSVDHRRMCLGYRLFRF